MVTNRTKFLRVLGARYLQDRSMGAEVSAVAATASPDSISDLNFSNMARRSASMSSCCLKSILRRGLAARWKRGLAANRGLRRARACRSKVGWEGGGGEGEM